MPVLRVLIETIVFLLAAVPLVVAAMAAVSVLFYLKPWVLLAGLLVRGVNSLSSSVLGVVCFVFAHLPWRRQSILPPTNMTQEYVRTW